MCGEKGVGICLVEKCRGGGFVRGGDWPEAVRLSTFNIIQSSFSQNQMLLLGAWHDRMGHQRGGHWQDIQPR